jgi:DNA-binding transcriptional ArsR family regulator
MTDVFTALLEPTRRDIVGLLAEKGPLAAGDIGQNFRVSASAISQHLKVLREADVVDVEKRAQKRIYTVNPDALIALAHWAAEMNRRFDRLDEVLKAEKKLQRKK